MQKVKLPNGQTVTFPDGMSPQDIQRAIKTNPAYAAPVRPAGLPPGVELRGLNAVTPPMAPLQSDGFMKTAQALKRATGGVTWTDFGKNSATVVGQHVKGLATGLYHAVRDPETPEESAMNPTGLPTPIFRAFVAPTEKAIITAIGQAKKGNWTGDSYDEQGNYQPSVVSAAMDAIPVAGPWARNIENDAQKYGAIPALFGLGVDVGLPELAGGVLSKGVGAVAPVVAAKISDAAERLGKASYGQFLNGGEKLPAEYANAPGAVLEAGPSVSFTTGRAVGLSKIGEVRAAAGADVAPAMRASTSRIPLSDVKDAVTSVLDPIREAHQGIYGDASVVDSLNRLQDSFGPAMHYQGTTTPAALWDHLQTLDDGIASMEDSAHPDVLAAHHGIRSNFADILQEHVPEAGDGFQRYSNLTDAYNLAKANVNVPGVDVGELARIGTKAVNDMSAPEKLGDPGSAVTNALLGAGAEALPSLWKAPFTQTGLATGAFQLGRGLKFAGPRLGPLLDNVRPVAQGVVTSLSPSLRPGVRFGPGSDPNSGRSQNQNYQGMGPDNRFFPQSAPLGGAIGVAPPLWSGQPQTTLPVPPLFPKGWPTVAR